MGAEFKQSLGSSGGNERVDECGWFVYVVDSSKSCYRLYICVCIYIYELYPISPTPRHHPKDQGRPLQT